MLKQANRVFPVGLLLEGQPCLVAGGGKVASRKVRLLLESGARVRVVAPEATPELADLSTRGTVAWSARPFEPADIEGCRLVYAATGDPAVNREILRLCRERRVLCCAVDAGWREGDFLTPAAFRDGDLTVAVSTGGRACRRSRLIRESLARHVEAVGGAQLLVLGTSHEQLSVEQREPLHVSGERQVRTGRLLRQVWGLHEFVLLNTCNRIELHAVGRFSEDAALLLRRILGFDRLADGQFYDKRDLDAFEHTCGLCAGLFSQMPGENHIVAQMKEAVDTATRAGWAAGMMKEWTAAVLHVSKEVRHATAPHLHGREIEDLAVDYLAAAERDWSGSRLLVLGTGKIGAGFLVHALSRLPQVRADWCYHRHCPEVPDDLGRRVDRHGLNALDGLLPAADVVVTALHADRYVLAAEHAPLLDRGRPVLVLDLAMPRNVAPELAARVPSLELVDLDGLKRWHRREQVDLPHLRGLCRDLVLGHREYYDKLVHSFQGWNAE